MPALFYEIKEMATVNKTHKDYDEYYNEMEMCEDCAEGQLAIHKKGKVYLPMLYQESKEEYNIRKSRALFYNAFWRTVAGLKGLIFRKPATYEATPEIESMMKNITLSGESLDEFCEEITQELLITGVVGILSEFPATSTDGMTVADVEQLNLKAYLTYYERESIINWHYDIVNNREQLTMVVLTECYYEKVNDFEYKEETRYKVLDIYTGSYRQRVYRINERGEDELLSEVFPIFNGQLLNEIPFTIIGEFESPPLVDLAYVNISHYQVSADYETGCHKIGLPVPWIAGYTKEDNTNLSLGDTAWIFPDPQAHAEYLEFKGTGMGALESNLARKEQQMAILGARMLFNEKKGIEAAETASIHRASENSVLASISGSISDAIEKAIGYITPDEFSYELNKDFIGKSLSAQEVTAYVQAWHTGGISHDALFYNLKRGEFYPENATFEDEQSKIDQMPLMTPTL
jgi:hypothetical protein